MVSRVAGKFSYLSTQASFSVPHSAWYALSLPKSVYPGLFHPVGFSGVWGPHPKFISGSLLRGVTTRAVLSSDCNRFLGAVAFKARLVAPSDSLRTSRKICDRLYHRTKAQLPGTPGDGAAGWFDEEQTKEMHKEDEKRNKNKNKILQDQEWLCEIT